MRISVKTLHLIVFAVISIMTATVFSACKGKQEMTVEDNGAAEDTTSVDSIAVAQEEEPTVDVAVPDPPKKADELFDDFAFAFMKNVKFQKSRINFPLPYVLDGNTKEISEKQWKYDSMYSRYEMYTLIFDNPKADKAAKDTKIDRVVVEELDLSTQRAKSYDFQRIEGEWKLTSLNDGAMTESANSDFYTFYHQFATDEEYRKDHIAQQLKFITFDDDEFKMKETFITPEEYEECSPELPQSKITNILYGQTFKNSNLRILSLRASASGMECQMEFRKSGGEWKLTRLEN